MITEDFRDDFRYKAVKDAEGKRSRRIFDEGSFTVDSDVPLRLLALSPNGVMAATNGNQVKIGPVTDPISLAVVNLPGVSNISQLAYSGNDLFLIYSEKLVKYADGKITSVASSTTQFEVAPNGSIAYLDGGSLYFRQQDASVEIAEDVFCFCFDRDSNLYYIGISDPTKVLCHQGASLLIKNHEQGRYPVAMAAVAPGVVMVALQLEDDDDDVVQIMADSVLVDDEVDLCGPFGATKWYPAFYTGFSSEVTVITGSRAIDVAALEYTGKGKNALVWPVPVDDDCRAEFPTTDDFEETLALGMVMDTTQPELVVVEPWPGAEEDVLGLPIIHVLLDDGRLVLWSIVDKEKIVKQVSAGKQLVGTEQVNPAESKEAKQPQSSGETLSSEKKPFGALGKSAFGNNAPNPFGGSGNLPFSKVGLGSKPSGGDNSSTKDEKSAFSSSGFGQLTEQAEKNGFGSSGFSQQSEKLEKSGFGSSGFGQLDDKTQKSSFGFGGFGQLTEKTEKSGFGSSGFGQLTDKTEKSGFGSSGFGSSGFGSSTTSNASGFGSSGFGQAGKSLFGNFAGDNNLSPFASTQNKQSPFGNAEPKQSPFASIGKSEDKKQPFEQMEEAAFKKDTPFVNIKSDDKPSLFGQKPSDKPPPFGQKAADTPTVFGGKPAHESSPFGAKSADDPSPFGQKSADATLPFGQKPAAGPTPFGQKPVGGPSPFGQKPVDTPPLFGQKPVDKPPHFGQISVDAPLPFGQKPTEKPSAFSFGKAFDSNLVGDKKTYSDLVNGQKTESGDEIKAVAGENTDKKIEKESFQKAPATKAPTLGFGQKPSVPKSENEKEKTTFGQNPIGSDGENTSLFAFPQPSIHSETDLGLKKPTLGFGSTGGKPTTTGGDQDSQLSSPTSPQSSDESDSHEFIEPDSVLSPSPEPRATSIGGLKQITAQEEPSPVYTPSLLPPTPKLEVFDGFTRAPILDDAKKNPLRHQAGFIIVNTNGYLDLLKSNQSKVQAVMEYHMIANPELSFDDTRSWPLTDVPAVTDLCNEDAEYYKADLEKLHGDETKLATTLSQVEECHILRGQIEVMLGQLRKFQKEQEQSKTRPLDAASSATRQKLAAKYAEVRNAELAVLEQLITLKTWTEGNPNEVLRKLFQVVLDLRVRIRNRAQLVAELREKMGRLEIKTTESSKEVFPVVAASLSQRRAMATKLN